MSFVKRLGFFAIAVVVVVSAVGCASEKPTPSRGPALNTTEGGQSSMFTVSSPAFENGRPMPTQFANVRFPGGQNVSVPLTWESAPEGTKSFALTMVDKNPAAKNWIHWMVIDIPARVSSLPEGASGTDGVPSPAKELDNTLGVSGYGGPTPPAGTGVHDYEITIYALAVDRLDLPQNATLNEFANAVNHVLLDKATLVGTVKR